MAPVNAPQAAPPVAATIHIYRGLMDRATTWRQRIDTPTNWAIITSGTSVSFVLNDPSHSHAVLLLVMLFTLSFLIIEARRTRYYDLWSSWVRLLETEYLAPILRDNQVTSNESWQRIMVRDMEYPHFKTSLWHLIGRRLRDNYLAIYTFLLMTWLLKLLIHQPPNASSSADTFIQHAAVGPVPGWLVMIAVLASYVALLALMFTTYRHKMPSIEVISRERILLRMTSPFQQPLSRRQFEPALLARFDEDGHRRSEPQD